MSVHADTAGMSGLPCDIVLACWVPVCVFVFEIPSRQALEIAQASGQLLPKALPGQPAQGPRPSQRTMWPQVNMTFQCSEF